MSADDWIECPFCGKKFDDRIKEEKDKLEAAYTKWTAKDYDELKERIEAAIHEIESQKAEMSLLRIDNLHSYGFDTEGNLTILLTADCENCGRKWRLEGKAAPKRRGDE